MVMDTEAATLMQSNRAIANPKDGFIWEGLCKRAGVRSSNVGRNLQHDISKIFLYWKSLCPDFTSWAQLKR